MTWDEQRRQRAVNAGHTQEMDRADIAGPAHADAPIGPDASGATRRWRDWGQRFGWIVASVLAAAALIFSVLAYANSGGSGTGFGARRGGLVRPYGGGYGFGGGASPLPAAPQGSPG